MIFLVALAVALVAGTLIAIGIQYDQGYVMMEYQDWVIETNIAVVALFFLVVFFLLHHLLRFLVATKRAPKRFIHYNAQRKLGKAQQALSKTTTLMLEGKWSDAEWQAVKLLPHSQTPLVHNLLAARAAFNQGAMERCKKYLNQAAESKEKNAVFAAKITHAELLLEVEKSRQALPLLQELQGRRPKNLQLLELLKKAYLQEEDWERLLEVLKDLDKKAAITPDENEKLALKAYTHLMATAAKEPTASALQILWSRMSEAMKASDVMAYQYINYLIDFGEDKEAANRLKSSLKKKWQPRLLPLYQRFRTDYAAHLKTLDGWLQLRGDDVLLLRVMGTVALSAELWQQSKEYLERSLELEQHADTFRVLGLVLERLDDPEAAARCFKKGLLLPIEVMPKQLVSD